MFRSNSSAEYIARSSKVVTLVDLAGHERYFKTTAYGLTGHMPDYACLIVGANAGLLTAALHPSSYVSAVCQVRLHHRVTAACQSDTLSIAALEPSDSRDSTLFWLFGISLSMLASTCTKTCCPPCRHCWNVQGAYGCSSGLEGASVLCRDQGGHLPRACAQAHLGHPASNPQEAWCEEKALHGESPTSPAPSACKPRHRGVESD